MTDWRHRAKCKDKDSEAWFPVGDDNGNESAAYLRLAEEAKTVCRSCPVVSDCLAWAIESGQGYGVAGGMTPRERRNHKQRLTRAAARAS